MYAREVKGQTLTFLVSGKLWGRSLVMGDVETKSEWSHILGAAMRGPLKGTELTSIPSVIASWKQWREDHPATTVTVFSRSAEEFLSDIHSQGGGFVVGLRHRGKIVAYPLERLSEAKVINDTLGGDPVVAAYDSTGRGTMIFRRTLNGEVLEFTVESGRLSGGGSHWSPTTGEAIDGPWKGKRLEPLSAILSYARTWAMFHPQGRVYGEDVVGSLRDP